MRGRGESPHELFGHPWAIREDEFRRVLAAALAFESNPENFIFLLGQSKEEERRPYGLVDGVAILAVQGALFRQQSMFSRFFGGRSYGGIANAFSQALADDEVHAIAFEVDSPGGDALGLAELSDRIYAARGTKPTTAVVRGLGASAAYFIASAADEVVAAREAMVGSIGTVASYTDWRDFDKRMGIREIQIVSSQSPKKRPDLDTDEGLAQVRRQVDDIAKVFVDSVARNRGVSVETVLADFGQGDVLIGQRAVDAGLADRIGTLDEVIASHQRKGAHWMNTVEVSKITAEWLKSNCPQVHAEIRADGEKAGRTAGEETGRAAGQAAGLEQGRLEGRAAGADAERARLLGIEAHAKACPGHEELIAKLKADPKITADAAAAAILAAEGEKKGKALAGLRADEDKITTKPAATPPADDAVSEAQLAKQIVEMARKSGAVE